MPLLGHVVPLWCGYFDVVRVSPFDPLARAGGSVWRRHLDQRRSVNIAPNPRYVLPTCKGCLQALQQAPGGLEAWAAGEAARALVDSEKP